MIMDVENNDVVGVGSFHYVGDEPHLWNRQQGLLAMLKESFLLKGVVAMMVKVSVIMMMVMVMMIMILTMSSIRGSLSVRIVCLLGE